MKAVALAGHHDSHDQPTAGIGAAVLLGGKEGAGHPLDSA